MTENYFNQAFFIKFIYKFVFRFYYRFKYINIDFIFMYKNLYVILEKNCIIYLIVKS